MQATLQSFCREKLTRGVAKLFGEQVKVLLAQRQPAAISCPPYLSRTPAQ
jgi:hypothetical protein